MKIILKSWLLIVAVLSLVACKKDDILNPAKIQWTHTNGTKQYANAPANGTLHSSTLTTTKADI